MGETMHSYWKTVRAATAANADDTKACVFAAMDACGFTLERTLALDSWSFVRRSWLFGVATRHEWQVCVTPDGPHTVMSVRFGLAPRALYYLCLLAGFGVSMATILPLTEHTGQPQMAILITLAAMGFALPLVHAFAIRLQATVLEKRLWPLLAALQPLVWSHTVIRNLNFAYGEDRVVASRELPATFSMGDGR
jgi:hypothetical protein